MSWPDPEPFHLNPEPLIAELGQLSVLGSSNNYVMGGSVGSGSIINEARETSSENVLACNFAGALGPFSWAQRWADGVNLGRSVGSCEAGRTGGRSSAWASRAARLLGSRCVLIGVWCVSLDLFN